jgi:hypothetical protein
MLVTKLFSLAVLWLVALAAVLIGQPPAATNAALSGVSSAIDVTYVVPWVKSGKVFHQKCDFLDGRFDVVVYKSKEGKCYFIPGRIDSMNIMIENEIKKSDATRFLEKYMTSFIQSMLSTPMASSIIITESYVKNMDAAERSIAEPYIINEKNPYISNTKDITISENEWVLNIYVITDFGAIESWSVSGTIDPLIITTFCRKIIKPNGTFRKVERIK